jgi:uncharacterized protein YjiS (DUF1127 family)
MTTTALSPARFGPAHQALKSILAPIGSAIAALRRASQRAAQRRELAALGDRALHDLGIDRTEIDSVLAESEGSAPWTRVRVVHALGPATPA